METNRIRNMNFHYHICRYTFMVLLSAIIGILVVFINPLLAGAATPPWQTFICEGRESDDLFIYGQADRAADLVVKITKGGGNLEAEYIYSTDGEKTWSDAGVVRNNSDIIIYDTADKNDSLGVKMRFCSANGYKAGSKYKLYLPIEYTIEAASNVGTGRLQVSSDEIIYNDSFKIVVKITKSGKLGEGEFIISTDGGSSFSSGYTIPDSGIVKIADNLITIRFWNDNKPFLVGDTYTCEIKGDMSRKDPLPSLLIVAGIILILLFFIIYRFALQRDIRKDYTVCEYKPVKYIKNRNLPSRRRF